VRGSFCATWVWISSTGFFFELREMTFAVVFTCGPFEVMD
jgi:hypothetical protein